MNGQSSPPPNPCFTVRPEVDGDRPWLLELYASTRKEELDAAGFPEPFRRPFLTQQFQARHASYATAFADAEWQVVCVAGTPAGRIIVHRCAHEIRIVDVALLPEHRGRGVGTRLLRELQSDAVRARCPLRLQVVPENPAVRLYRRLGFVVTGNEGLRLQMEWDGKAANPTPDAP